MAKSTAPEIVSLSSAQAEELLVTLAPLLSAETYQLVEKLVRITAQSLFAATRFELEKLRCKLCGKTFTAAAPPEAGLEKYDPNVGPRVGYLRLGGGLPHYRLDRMQTDQGVPLPASTQWEPMAKETGAATEGKERTGIFTTSRLSEVEGHRIARFITGHPHAGENLDQLLARRAKEASAPIPMCDALSRNPAKEFETIS